MEVGHHTSDHPVTVARSYDYASGGYERVGAVLREISVYIGKCIFCRQAGVLVGVRIPLRNFSVPFPLTDEATDVVKAFKGAYRCGAHGYDTA